MIIKSNCASPFFESLMAFTVRLMPSKQMEPFSTTYFDNAWGIEIFRSFASALSLKCVHNANPSTCPCRRCPHSIAQLQCALQVDCLFCRYLRGNKICARNCFRANEKCEFPGSQTSFSTVKHTPFTAMLRLARHLRIVRLIRLINFEYELGAIRGARYFFQCGSLYDSSKHIY